MLLPSSATCADCCLLGRCTLGTAVAIAAEARGLLSCFGHSAKRIRGLFGGVILLPPNHCFLVKPYLDIGPIENRARPTSEPSTRAWKSSVELDPSSLMRYHAKNGNDGDLATEMRTAEQENPWWQVELSEPTVRAATFWILDFLCKHRFAITLFMRLRCEADGETPFQA